MKRISALVLLKLLDDLCMKFTLGGLITLSCGTKMNWIGFAKIIESLRHLVDTEAVHDSYLSVVQLEVLVRQIFLNIGAIEDDLTSAFIKRLQFEAMKGEGYEPEKLNAAVIPQNSFPKDEVVAIVEDAVIYGVILILNDRNWDI